MVQITDVLQDCAVLASPLATFFSVFRMLMKLESVTSLLGALDLIQRQPDKNKAERFRYVLNKSLHGTNNSSLEQLAELCEIEKHC